MSYEVRAARPEDLPALAAVERYHAEGFVAIAEHARDGIVGFVVARPLGGCAHIQEMDVHPNHGRLGLGRRLLDMALAWARGAGYRQVTLTTFRDVAWNAPFYARCGFRSCLSPTPRRSCSSCAGWRVPTVCPTTAGS